MVSEQLSKHTRAGVVGAQAPQRGFPFRRARAVSSTSAPPQGETVEKGETAPTVRRNGKTQKRHWAQPPARTQSH